MQAIRAWHRAECPCSSQQRQQCQFLLRRQVEVNPPGPKSSSKSNTCWPPMGYDGLPSSMRPAPWELLAMRQQMPGMPGCVVGESTAGGTDSCFLPGYASAQLQQAVIESTCVCWQDTVFQGPCNAPVPRPAKDQSPNGRLRDGSSDQTVGPSTPRMRRPSHRQGLQDFRNGPFWMLRSWHHVTGWVAMCTVEPVNGSVALNGAVKIPCQRKEWSSFLDRTFLDFRSRCAFWECIWIPPVKWYLAFYHRSRFTFIKEENNVGGLSPCSAL